MTAFNELLTQVREMDGQASGRNPEPGQVDVETETQRHILKKDGPNFKLSYTETESLPPGMMSKAGPESSTITYTIKPNQIVKESSSNRRPSSNPVILDTVNGYILS